MAETKSAAAAVPVEKVVIARAGALPDAYSTATNSELNQAVGSNITATSGAFTPADGCSSVHAGEIAVTEAAVARRAGADGLASDADGGRGCADETQLAIELRLHLADGLKARSGRGIVRMTASCRCEEDPGKPVRRLYL